MNEEKKTTLIVKSQNQEKDRGLLMFLALGFFLYAVLFLLWQYSPERLATSASLPTPPIAQVEQ